MTYKLEDNWRLLDTSSAADRLLPEQFADGVILHTGRHRRWIDRGVEVVPIAALWGRRRASEAG